MLIGICGLAGSGKDTVAGIICEHFFNVRFAFSDALRDDMLRLNPIVDATITYAVSADGDVKYLRLQDAIERVGWDQAKRQWPEIRRLLQVYGTEVHRANNPNYWVDRLETKLETSGDYSRAVISDVRFDTEVMLLKRRQGIILGVQRPGIEKMSHASEQLDVEAVSDAIILNDGDKEDLKWSTIQAVESLMEDRGVVLS